MKERHWTQKQLLNNLLEKKMGGCFLKGCLKRLAEALIMTRKELSIRTNNIKIKTVNVDL